MLPSLRALISFEAVARLGSIGAAAREMNVSQAAVSQQLKSLEQFLGSTLFERSQRGVVLTQAAQQYLPVVDGALQHLKLQTQLLFGDQHSDVLRLKVNHSIGNSWLIPRLDSFYARFPFIRLDLTLVDWPSREPCSDADIEITNGYMESDTTRFERLFQEHWLMVCSPSFKQQHLKALAKGDISGLPAIQVKGYGESWLQWLSHNRYLPVLPKVLLEISNSLHGLEAVRQGIGLMLVRSLVAEEWLYEGKVVTALKGNMSSDSSHYLITRQQRPAKVSYFCDWMHQQCSSQAIVCAD